MNDLIARFSEEHPEESRKVFDAVIASTTDPEKIAGLELNREFYCNPDFRRRFMDYIWERVQALG